jgi:hypothetical protein
MKKKLQSKKIKNIGLIVIYWIKISNEVNLKKNSEVTI